MDSKRRMIFIKPFPLPRQLMTIIGTNRISGKKDTLKRHKRRKKEYPSDYEIIKVKIQKDKQNRLQKAETEGQDDMSL